MPGDGWMDGSAHSPTGYFTSRGWLVGPSCGVTSNQCSLQGEAKAGQTEGGIVFATKKLHAAWAAFLTVFWALRTGFPELLEKQEQAEVLIFEVILTVMGLEGVSSTKATLCCSKTFN